MPKSLRGLYVITDSRLLEDAQLIPAVEATLLGGARLVQYRDKQHDATTRHRQARELLALCRQHNAPLIINDDVELAAAIGADGVHLGRDDMDIASARALLGPQAIIGLSCYANPRTEGLALADYAAFGRFFTSATKPDAPPVNLEVLVEARRQLSSPIVAIGGITADNGAPLVAAGADMLAVVGGVFDQSDIRVASQRLAALFD